MNEKYIDDALKAYLITAAWTEEKDGAEFDDFADEAKARARYDIGSFCYRAEVWLDDMPAGDAGHNFWLSRNGHGTGFWDKDIKYPDLLHDIAVTYGETDLYEGDDNKLYFS